MVFITLNRLNSYEEVWDVRWVIRSFWLNICKLKQLFSWRTCKLNKSRDTEWRCKCDLPNLWSFFSPMAMNKHLYNFFVSFSLHYVSSNSKLLVNKLVLIKEWRIAIFYDFNRFVALKLANFPNERSAPNLNFRNFRAVLLRLNNFQPIVKNSHIGLTHIKKKS